MEIYHILLHHLDRERRFEYFVVPEGRSRRVVSDSSAVMCDSQFSGWTHASNSVLQVPASK